MQQRTLWISWLHQRRTSVLAEAMQLPLYTFAFGGPRALRHLRAILATVALLARERPRVVIVQNPSVFLGALVCLLRPIFRFKAVVDRHSNFDFANTETGLFNRISNFSLNRADLTIVTNEAVARIVEQKGGRAIVLQDRLPKIRQTSRTRLAGQFNVVFVCSFSGDEPIANVLEAARLVDPAVCLYVTGNDRKLDPALRPLVASNVVFTGFLSSEDYDNLLRSCDVVLVLTTREHTLTSGAYEALGADKPLILSSTVALTEYFRRAAVRTGSSSAEISAAIGEAWRRLRELESEVGPLKAELTADWDDRFQTLMERLNQLSNS